MEQPHATTILAVRRDGQVVMARTETGCIWGDLLQIGPRWAYLQRRGHSTRTRVPAETVRPWPPEAVETKTKSVRRGGR